jgi:hypothetical protein
MFSTAGQEHSHSFYFDDSEFWMSRGLITSLIIVIAVDPGPDPGPSNEPLLGEPGSQEEERQGVYSTHLAVRTSF